MGCSCCGCGAYHRRLWAALGCFRHAADQDEASPAAGCWLIDVGAACVVISMGGADICALLHTVGATAVGQARVGVACAAGQIRAKQLALVRCCKLLDAPELLAVLLGGNLWSPGGADSAASTEYLHTEVCSPVS